ncbi:MAG: hypothetical protein ACYTEM_08575, partial [Planctomycetota bacterium]
NDSGQVVGRSMFDESNAFHAYLYNTTEGMLDLNNLIPME